MRIFFLGFIFWFLGTALAGELPRPLCRTNADCSPQEFCQKEGCGLELGFCRPRPELCLQVYTPVCGCDGRTYANACLAQAAGVNVAAKGPCGLEFSPWLSLWVEGARVSAAWGALAGINLNLYYAPYPAQRPIFSLPVQGNSLTVTLPNEAAFYVAVGGSPANGTFSLSNIAYFRLKPIWRPAPGTTWQWQLTQPIDLSVEAEMYDVDLFETPKEVIAELKRRGRVVICYFSAGSLEAWRPDAGQFPEDIIGAPLEGWPDERWLDIRQLGKLAPLMKARLDLAVAKGCDGVEPDNVDAYLQETGFPLTYEDQLRYNVWLALEAHKRGLSVGLKNDPEQAAVLEPFFDWALVEECFTFGQCEAFLPFVEQGKAVFGVEYELEPEEFCPQAKALGFSFMKKQPELDSWRQPCW